MVGRSTLQLFDPEAGPPELIHGDEVIEPVDAAVEAPVEIMAMQGGTFLPWCAVTVMAGSHPEVERARRQARGGTCGSGWSPATLTQLRRHIFEQSCTFGTLQC